VSSFYFFSTFFYIPHRLTFLEQGIFWAFVIFNFMLVFIFSWLYLHGVRDTKRWLSERKTKRVKNAAN
jgi:hypothetical protein